MKKSKLLIPTLSMVGLTTMATPILATSCSVTTCELAYFPTSEGSPFGETGYYSQLLELTKGKIYNFDITIDSKDDIGVKVFALGYLDKTELVPIFCKFSVISTKVDSKTVDGKIIEEDGYRFEFNQSITTAGAKIQISIKAEEDCEVYASGIPAA